MKRALAILCCVVVPTLAFADDPEPAPDQASEHGSEQAAEQEPEQAPAPDSGRVAFSLPAAVIAVGVGSLASGCALFAIQYSEAAALRNEHMTRVTGDTYSTDLTREEFAQHQNRIWAEFYSAIGLTAFGLLATAAGVAIEIFLLPSTE